MLQNESELLEGGEEWEKWTMKEWDQATGGRVFVALQLSLGEGRNLGDF